MNENIVNASLGRKLTLLRKNNLLSQYKVANELGISRQTLSEWETGKSYPDAIYLYKISDIYKVSVNELLSDECESNLKQLKRNSNKFRKIYPIIYVIDIIASIIIISYSKNMFFWILYFHIIIFVIYQIVRLAHFIKDVRDQHK